jgi:catechol 2,3-dioxygenase-like lactoylglutathione lyase family enzyme
MHVDRVLESVLYAQDLEAAEKFYTDVVGLHLLSKMEGRHLFFTCGPGMLLIFNPEDTNVPLGEIPTHGAHGPGHIAFAIDASKLDEVRAHLEIKHVDIEREVTWESGVTSIYVRDPAGNSVEFAPPQLWGLV